MFIANCFTLALVAARDKELVLRVTW